MTFDPRAEVRRRSASSGVILPEATVDELVAYLEDLYTTALDEGAGEAEAKRRAYAALQESSWSVLQRHASRHPDRSHAARADVMMRPPGPGIRIVSTAPNAFL